MKEKTKFWVIADTHFGHDNIIELAGRPVEFESKIIKSLVRTVKREDVLIHLGDFCIGRDAYWHDMFMSRIGCKKWLIRGDHDRQTDTWYLGHGWDFVGESATIDRYGETILFTHRPVSYLDLNFGLNVHGHLHGDKHRHSPANYCSTFNKLIAMEHDYRPFDLRKVVGK